jgi:hypothetical protein
MSRNDGICARLRVLVSSRHNGPAFIAVTTSSMAEKAVPISAAEISIPGFSIRFNVLRLSGGPVARQLSTWVSLIAERKHRRYCVTHSTRALHVRIARTDRASYHTQQALSQRIGPNPAECKPSFSSPILQRILTHFPV